MLLDENELRRLCYHIVAESGADFESHELSWIYGRSVRCILAPRRWQAPTLMELNVDRIVPMHGQVVPIADLEKIAMANPAE